MNNSKKIKLFLVDDDALFLKNMEIEFLDKADIEVSTFSTGEKCLASLKQKPDVIILDFHLDGIVKNAMNGLSTLDGIKKNNPKTPVIMLSSQDKIEVAISCMHHGATDYVVKSETAFFRIQKIMTTIFLLKKMEKELNWYIEKM